MSYSYTTTTTNDWLYLFTASNDWSHLITASNDWSHTVNEEAQEPPEDGIQTKAGGYILTKSGEKIQIK